MSTITEASHDYPRECHRADAPTNVDVSEQHGGEGVAKEPEAAEYG